MITLKIAPAAETGINLKFQNNGKNNVSFLIIKSLVYEENSCNLPDIGVHL